MNFQRCMAAATCAAAVCGAAVAQQARAPRAPAAATAPAPATATSPEVAEKEAAGQLAAQGWLTILDRRDWGTAWETSGTGFRNTVPIGTWIDGIPKVRGPLGALQDRRPVAVVHKRQLQGFPDGDYVTVVFASRFDAKEVEEIVTTVRESDGRWRVNGYAAQ